MNARAAKLQRDLVRLSAELMEELQNDQAPEDPPPPWLSIEDFAKRIGVCRKTVYRMIADGMPIGRPRPNTVRIPVADAETWIRKRAARAAAEHAASLDVQAEGVR